MEFNLFGIDIIPSDGYYGFWFFDITIYKKNEDGDSRSLFSIYFMNKSISIDLFFFNIFDRT